MNTLGERIKLARENLHINQEELSTLSGISRSNISRIESNKIKPTSDSIIAFMHALNVSSDWLLTGSTPHQIIMQESIPAPEFKELYEMYNELPNKDKIDVSTYIRVRYSILKENEILSTFMSTNENESEEENNIA